MMKKIYDILNYHLGTKTNRGQIRLPDKYDELKADLGAYLSHMYKFAFNEGRDSAIKLVRHSVEEASREIQSKRFELRSNKPIDRAGTEKIGLVSRWLSGQHCTFCGKTLRLKVYEPQEGSGMMTVMCTNKKCGKSYYMYQSECG